MVERTTPKKPIELAWDEYVASMEGRLYGQTDAFKFAWMAAKRTWVGLTDEEINEWTPEIHGVIQAIEAKLKEKNGA